MAPKGNTKGRATRRVDTSSNVKAAQKPSSMISEVKGLPQWPRLQPLLPSYDLKFESVLDGQIMLVRKFFTSSLCQKYVSFLSTLPLTTTPGNPKKGDAVRVNDRFQVQDAKFARQLWEETSLKNLVLRETSSWGGDACGLNPNIRIYRYKQGQFFDQHYDDSNAVTLSGDQHVAARTTWTLLIYLTGPSTGCVGGETVFYPEVSITKGSKKTASLEPISVAPEVGLALLHKHGDDCLLHEGKIVQGGEKWIIRSDLCVLR